MLHTQSAPPTHTHKHTHTHTHTHTHVCVCVCVPQQLELTLETPFFDVHLTPSMAHSLTKNESPSCNTPSAFLPNKALARLPARVTYGVRGVWCARHTVCAASGVRGGGARGGGARIADKITDLSLGAEWRNKLAALSSTEQTDTRWRSSTTSEGRVRSQRKPSKNL